MDYYEFFTENKEFKIVLKKQKKVFNTSEFSNYICTLEFRDTLDRVLVSINSSELSFVRFVEGLNDFIVSFGQILDNILYFPDSGTQGSNYFFYIAINPGVYYPAEDDDKVYLNLFEHSYQGQVLRISLETSIFWIEEFIYSIFQILEDIPYLEHLTVSTALEFIDYSLINRTTV